MSDVYSQLGYSTREFQALQLVVLVVFGVAVFGLITCLLYMLVYILEISFEWQLVFKIDIME